MEWCAKYVGIPFAEHGAAADGCDCWGLVRLVYAELLGVALPDFDAGYADTSDGDAIAALCRAERRRWREVDEARPLDVILLRLQGRPWHVGLVAGAGKMLHALRGIDAAIEDYTRPLWARRIEGFYRWQS
jgi:cell wall-associated NlpC family hydrolase